MSLARQSLIHDVALAVLSAVVWRAELELHGWAGLDWIQYFHWAIPVAVLLFLAWLFLFVPVSSNARRAGVVFATAVAGVVWFWGVQFALFYHFNGGPSAFVQLLAVGEKSYRIYANLIYIVVPLTPMLFAGLLYMFGLKPTISRLGLSVAIYVLACPISIGILSVLSHPGAADALHTIKSGIIIPFLVMGLGVLVPKRKEGQQAECTVPVKAAPSASSTVR